MINKNFKKRKKINNVTVINVRHLYIALSIFILLMCVCLGSFYKIYKVNDYVTNNFIKNEDYNKKIEEMNKIIENKDEEINNLLMLEDVNNELKKNNQLIIEENKKLHSINEDLIEENNAYSRTIKVAAQAGVHKPVNRGSTPTFRINKEEILNNQYKGEYLGEWKITYYTATPEECDSNPSITASGEKVKPGFTIAVDPKYWKIGKDGDWFVIEGIGIVRAEDTGSKVKGKNRADILVADKNLARMLSGKKLKVWKYEGKKY